MPIIRISVTVFECGWDGSATAAAASVVDMEVQSQTVDSILALHWAFIYLLTGSRDYNSSNLKAHVIIATREFGAVSADLHYSRPYWERPMPYLVSNNIGPSMGVGWTQIRSRKIGVSGLTIGYRLLVSMILPFAFCRAALCHIYCSGEMGYPIISFDNGRSMQLDRSHYLVVRNGCLQAQ